MANLIPLLFANNAQSNLAGGITPSSLSVSLTSGTGALFPNPGAGQYFCMTFNDFGTGLLREIVHVTAVVGDTMTIVRAQEGTAAQNWNAGDIAANLVTAGTMQAFAQSNSAWAYADDTGTANAIAIAPSPVFTAYFEGMKVRFKLLNAITGASTINVNGLGNVALTKAGSVATAAGDGPVGYEMEACYDGTRFQITAVSPQSIPSGIVNRFRNGTTDIWSRGTSGTITAGSPAYSADGWIISSTTANVTWAQATGLAYTKFALQIVGLTSVTDTYVKQRIESYIAAVLQGQVVTVQARIQNNTGATLTPNLTVNHPTAADNYAGTVTDVNAVALQSIGAGATAVVAWAYTAAANSIFGQEVIIDFGAALNSNAKNVVITEFDIRVTPNAIPAAQVTGPPAPELRPIPLESLFCGRYLPAFTGAGGSGTGVIAPGGGFSSPTAGNATGTFAVPTRVPVTGMTINAAGNFSGYAGGQVDACGSITFSAANDFGFNIGPAGYSFITPPLQGWSMSLATNTTNASMYFTGAEL